MTKSCVNKIIFASNNSTILSTDNIYGKFSNGTVHSRGFKSSCGSKSGNGTSYSQIINS